MNIAAASSTYDTAKPKSHYHQDIAQSDEQRLKLALLIGISDQVLLYCDKSDANDPFLEARQAIKSTKQRIKAMADAQANSYSEQSKFHLKNYFDFVVVLIEKHIKKTVNDEMLSIKDRIKSNVLMDNKILWSTVAYGVVSDIFDRCAIHTEKSNDDYTAISSEFALGTDHWRFDFIKVQTSETKKEDGRELKAMNIEYQGQCLSKDAIISDQDAKNYDNLTKFLRLISTFIIIKKCINDGSKKSIN